MRRSLAPSPTSPSISAAISRSCASIRAYSLGETGVVLAISRLAAVYASPILATLCRTIGQPVAAKARAHRTVYATLPPWSSPSIPPVARQASRYLA